MHPGELPLCIALEYRHWDIAKFLLSKGCETTKRQKSDATPLHIAAASGAPEVLLAKLLKLGAQVDALDDCHLSALCRAAEAGHDEIADWLLEHGADITLGHENGSTPVYCALCGQHLELASHLIDRGGKSTLHQAVQCNHLARARQKLNAGADANELEDPPHGQTPLEMAIWLDSTDMVALLLEFGADPNQQDRSFQGERGMIGGNTSLHEAVFKGSAKLVKLLLAHGADPDIANADGATPIELAERTDRSHLAHLMEAHLDKKLCLDAAQTGIEPLYTVQKVADLLSVDDTFILELIKARKIVGLHLDEKTLRITAGSVQRYLAKLTK
jgi:ankyrin repeat protein